MVRFMYIVFAPVIATTKQFSVFLMVIAALTVLVGEIAAYRQHDVKRLLAFSSTAQVGYMVLGIFQGVPLDLWAAYYIFLGTD